MKEKNPNSTQSSKFTFVLRKCVNFDSSVPRKHYCRNQREIHIENRCEMLKFIGLYFLVFANFI